MKKRNILLVCIVLTLIIITVGIVYWVMSAIDVSEYQVLDYNIVWEECKKREIDYHILPNIQVYYKIVNVPADEYIACRYYGKGIGADQVPRVLVHKDVDPSFKLDISSAGLYFGRFNGANFSDEDWLLYGKRIQESEILKIDEAVARKLADCITAENREYINTKDYEDWWQCMEYVYDSNQNVLMIQYSLEKYSELLWMANIVHYKDDYYIELKDGSGSYGNVYGRQYMHCPEELAVFIEQIVSTNGSSNPQSLPEQ